ncbi:MAG: RcpC/CpaB family pilus assembly protein [Sporichthyaceae bacterium]
MTTGAPSAGGGLDRWLRELRHAVLWRRRLLAAGLLAGAAAFGLQALAPAPPRGVPVLVAAHDVPAGAALDNGDVRRVDRPASLVPAGALTAVGQASGATVSSAVRRGEVLTDVRLLGPSALHGLPAGSVAAPVRLADGDAAALLRPGDVVDVLAAGAGGGAEARLVASAVRVLGVPADRGTLATSLASSEGALVLLATTSATASRLAAAAVDLRLSIAVHGR